MEWLSSKNAPLLPRVDRSTKGTESDGRVSVNFDAGILLLAPQGRPLSEATRLVYEKGATALPLAAGDYQVRHYVISRLDDKGVEWNLWATGQGRALTVRAGEETKVDLALDPVLKTSTKRNGARVMCGGSFSGDSGMGLSLVKDTRRIVPRWSIELGGKSLASGEAPYG